MQTQIQGGSTNKEGGIRILGRDIDWRKAVSLLVVATTALSACAPAATEPTRVPPTSPPIVEPSATPLGVSNERAPLTEQGKPGTITETREANNPTPEKLTLIRMARSIFLADRFVQENTSVQGAPTLVEAKASDNTLIQFLLIGARDLQGNPVLFEQRVINGTPQPPAPFFSSRQVTNPDSTTSSIAEIPVMNNGIIIGRRKVVEFVQGKDRKEIRVKVFDPNNQAKFIYQDAASSSFDWAAFLTGAKPAEAAPQIFPSPTPDIKPAAAAAPTETAVSESTFKGIENYEIAYGGHKFNFSFIVDDPKDIYRTAEVYNATDIHVRPDIGDASEQIGRWIMTGFFNTHRKQHPEFYKNDSSLTREQNLVNQFHQFTESFSALSIEIGNIRGEKEDVPLSDNMNTVFTVRPTMPEGTKKNVVTTANIGRPVGFDWDKKSGTLVFYGDSFTNIFHQTGWYEFKDDPYNIANLIVGGGIPGPLIELPFSVDVVVNHMKPKDISKQSDQFVADFYGISKFPYKGGFQTENGIFLTKWYDGNTPTEIDANAKPEVFLDYLLKNFPFEATLKNQVAVVK